MPLPTQGPDPRALTATETPKQLPDASSPPPLPLVRRKVTQQAALGLPVPTGLPAPVHGTAPWPIPPSDLHESDFSSAETTAPFGAVHDSPSLAAEADPDFAPASKRWWRALKAPSRPIWIGALVAMLTGGLGWTVGAKPWASQRTAGKAIAAKPSPNPSKVGQASSPNRVVHTATHVNRRVATNTRVASNAKSKTPLPVKAPAKASNKALKVTTPVTKTPAKASTKALKATTPAAKAPAKANAKSLKVAKPATKAAPVK